MSLINSNVRLTENPIKIRPAAVAGMFYPADPAELEQMVTSYLDKASSDTEVPKAIIAPHAGYVYSGSIAAAAYAKLIPARHTIKRVILLGPAHRVYVKGLALASATSFSTPLGDVPIDTVLTEKLLQLPQVSVMDSAHAQEHSLEVQLPFLQLILDGFTLLPLLVGDASTEQVSQVLEAVWGGDETLIIISSDLSHYHSYETAQQIDASTSAAINDFRLHDISPEHACGCVPMRGLLHIAKHKGMQIRTLDVRNSGDTAGTHDRVVGYGAYSLYLKLSVSSKQRQQLLNIARQTIEQGFTSNTPLKPDPDQYDPGLRQQRATFVTLKLNQQLRGCIGTTQAVSPLIVSVADNAFKAAFRDPRFKPLSQSEYDKIDLSISLLSAPAELEFSCENDLLKALRPGIDGLIIEKGSHKATFLPEVWQTLPDAEAFLTQLKLKAGIDDCVAPDRAWRYISEHLVE